MCCDWVTVDQKSPASPVGASAPRASTRVGRESLRYSGADHLRIITGYATHGRVRALTAANAEHINVATAAPIKVSNAWARGTAGTRTLRRYRHAVPVVPSIRQGSSAAMARLRCAGCEA